MLISKMLLFGGALFREGRLSESGRSVVHLRYFLVKCDLKQTNRIVKAVNLASLPLFN